MDIPFVDLKSQYISIKKEIDNSIENVINETAFIKGKFVEQFEEDFSKSYSIKNVISCGNGTDAIYIALKSLGIGIGDEVITTAHSWISTSETISQTGAKVVFVDIDEETFNINPDLIEDKISNNTKAIIPVHLFGHPANMTKIMKIAKKYKLKVIEDCAQAHYAEWNNQKVGTFGDAGTFSFFPGKNLGAYGDAGCIITNNQDLALKMRRFSKHGALGKHDHEIEGINSRLDGIQAAILSVKLNYILDWTELRIQIAKCYHDKLSDQIDFELPFTHNLAKHVFHLYVIRSNKRDMLFDHLKSNGVGCGIHYPVALPFLKAYKHLNHVYKDFPIAFKYSNEILSLPIFPELSTEQLNRVVFVLKKLI